MEVGWVYQMKGGVMFTYYVRDYIVAYTPIVIIVVAVLLIVIFGEY